MSDLPNFSDHGYQVKRQLGHNYTGGRTTYLAISTNTRQPVVIKQFEFAKSNSNWSAYEAYHREIEVLQGLDHSGIPRYLDCFETSSGLCLVQEYKKARSLADNRSFDAAEIKKIAASLLEILVYLQNRVPPVIHRDIKPENILVDDKINVYLVDFGFARIGEGEVSMSSMVKGSLGFMPPEHLFNRQLTEASDLYSVGATLVCLVTGTKSSAITNLMDDNYRLHFRHLAPKLSFRWLEWLEKMVQLRPKDRFPNAATALQALKSIYVIRTPEVKLSPSSLNFNAKKLGEKITQTIMVSNPIPDTLLEGNWEVAPHPSDPPHKPDTHSWIYFQPARFENNRFNCKITVDTSHLMAGTTYNRTILLHTNSLPETQTLNLTIRTAPIPVKTKQLPYLASTLLVLLVTVGTWFEATAWSGIIEKFGNIGLFIAAWVTMFVAIVGAGTAFLAKPIGGFVAKTISRSKANVAKAISRSKAKLKVVDTAVVALIAGFMAMLVVGIATKFRDIDAAVGAFTAVDALIFLAGFDAESVAENSVKRGFSSPLGLAIAILATALGISLGMGCYLGFLNPLVISAVLTVSVPLGMMMFYPPLQRAMFIANYRKSQQHLIKP